MPHHALDERHELCQTLRGCAPDAATLCGDWTVALLTAHMVARERSLVEGLGRLPVASFRQRAETRLAQLVDARPYPDLVNDLEAGPGRLSPFAIPALRESVNLLEYAIHHEDIRRIAPATAPRPLTAARQRAIWQRLRVGAALTMRTVPVGVRLSWPGHGQILTHRAKKGAATVTVTGDPMELALVAFGRQRVARVDYDGTDTDIVTVSGARIAV